MPAARSVGLGPAGPRRVGLRVILERPRVDEVVGVDEGAEAAVEEEPRAGKGN